MAKPNIAECNRHSAVMRTAASLLIQAAIALHLLGAATVYAQQSSAEFAFQDQKVIRQKVEEFLLTQSMGSPGAVKVSAGKIDSRVNLPQCASLETFLPAGSRAWGKTTVGVRCASPSAWTIYVQATVSIVADYLVAANPLPQGRIIGQEDVFAVKGDLTTLPPGIFTNASQAIGRTVSISLTAGSVLRRDMLREQLAVQQGQKVRLFTSGNGFRISSEGSALANASDGQVVQAKAANGQVVAGIARNGGQIEVSY